MADVKINSKQDRKGSVNMKDIEPVCLQKHTEDCFAFSDGRCTVLRNCDFKGKPCKFYKTVGRLEIEKAKCAERLKNLNLIGKY